MKIRSLSFKLILSYALIITLTFSLLGIFLYKDLKGNYLKDLINSLISQALLIEAQIPPLSVARKDIQSLNKLVKDLNSRINLRVTLIDREGVVLADSEKSSQEVLIMDNHSNRPEIRFALEGAVGNEIRYSDTLKMDMLYVAVPLSEKGDITGSVRLAIPLMGVEKMLGEIRGILILSILFSLSVSFILGTFFALKIIKPVNKIISVAKKYSLGNFSHRVYHEANDEIGELAAALNKMAKDIEEKVSAIKDQSQQLTAVFNSMIEGVIVASKAGVVVSINQAVEKVFDVKKQDVEGKHFLEAIRNNEISGVIDLILKEGKQVTKEIILIFPVQRIFEVNATPIFNDNTVNGALVVIHDITEIRRLETVRRDFVANVSHELKTPLTSIKGFVETLLEGALEDKENNRNFLKIIQTHADRLDTLVNDLLSLSKLESEGIEIRKSVFDLHSQVNEVLKGFKSQLKVKEIKVENILPEGLKVFADQDKIYQVLVNLVDNAIKFNKDNGFIKVYSELTGIGIKIIIEDSGMGIPSKDIVRIFERFYRVDKARSRELGGTGLGLSIVKHIIELHAGVVGVESLEGLGSKFWFTLPK